MSDLKMPDVVFCSTCVFWQAVERSPDGVPVGGLCRRYPPTPFLVNGPPNALGQPSVQITSQFPPTQSNQYCGEHDDGTDADELDSMN